MTSKVFVAGVGMIPFKKPGTSEPYDVMGAEAMRAALADAGIGYDDVQQAYAGYVYGDSTCGQKALYHVGMTGIPVINVNNNCSTGSSALFLARQAVQSGAVDCALALGFEFRCSPGALKSQLGRPRTGARTCAEGGRRTGRPHRSCRRRSASSAAPAARTCRSTARKLETFAAIRAKASRHAANNPLAVFRNVVTTEDVMADADDAGTA